MTIFDDNFLMTIFDDIETIFDNWKDSPGDLTFETLITILTNLFIYLFTTQVRVTSHKSELCPH